MAIDGRIYGYDGLDLADFFPSTKPHNHKNFTTLGLLFNYLCGFLIFGVLYLLSYDIHWYYYKLDRKRMNMFVYSVRFVRLIHAALATMVSIPIMLITSDFLKERFVILDMFVAFSGGYWTFDLLGRYNEHLQVYEPPGRYISKGILKRYVKRFWLTIFHHLFLVMYIYPKVLFARNDEGDFLVACILFTEFCVPFTELQWMMESTLEPHNLRYIYVSMFALATTLVSRVLIIPFLYEAVSEHMNMSMLDLITTIAPWWHILAISYFAYNVHQLGKNIVKVVIYLRIPYEKKKKAKPGPVPTVTSAGGKRKRLIKCDKEERAVDNDAYKED